MTPETRDLRPSRELTAHERKDPTILPIKYGLVLSCDDAERTPWEAWRDIARGRILAVAAAMRSECVFVGPSALVLHKIPQWVHNPDVRVRTHSRYPGCELPAIDLGPHRVPAVRSLQWRVDPGGPCHIIDGVRVDSLEDTALLMALSAHPLEAFVAACAILRTLSRFDRFDLAASRARAQTVKVELLARIDGLSGRKGSKRARVILSLADAACENIAESALLWVLLTVCPYEVEAQHVITVDGRVFFADFAVPQIRLIIEFDGMDKLGSDEREFRVKRRQLMDRQQRLERAGWQVVRVQWSDSRDFTRLRSELALALGLRLAQAGPGPHDAPSRAAALGAGMWKPVPASVNGRDRRFI